MKISSLSQRPLMVLGAALMMGSAHQANAQTPAAAVAEAQTQTIEIPVRNVNANVLAFWLKSPRQTLPADVQLSADKIYFDGFPWESGRANGPQAGGFPDGVVSVVSAPDGKSLTATGTTAGLQTFKQQVADFEVPLRFVEVEAQMMSIAPADLNALNISFGAPALASAHQIKAEFVPSVTPFQGQQSYRMGLLSDDLGNKLRDLLLQGKVHDSSGLRASIINGLTATMKSRSTTTPTVELRDGDSVAPLQRNNGEDSKPLEEMDAGETVETGFKATPIIKDGFIALDFQITLQGRSTQMSAVFKDGQTLAVQLPGAKVEPGNVMIALVTARIKKQDEVQTQ